MFYFTNNAIDRLEDWKEMREKKIVDLIIIGGGPIGMFASYYAGMRELDTMIIEGLPILGGQIELIYPEKEILDIGAIPLIKGKDLVTNLRQQMSHFQPRIHTNESVLKINEEENIFVVETDQTVHYSRSILLTAGQGAFEPRKLRFDYPERYEETNLHYYVNPLETYRNKNVVICGGGDSAVDWALMLKDIAKKVTLVHRRNRFRAHEASVSRLKDSSIEVLTPYAPVDLIGDENEVKEVVVQKSRGQEKLHLETDFFIVSFGFISDSQQLSNWGIANKNGSALVSQKMATNVQGIYAAGDAATFDGKVRLIATGFGEVPTAINSIINYISADEN